MEFGNRVRMRVRKRNVLLFCQEKTVSVKKSNVDHMSYLFVQTSAQSQRRQMTSAVMSPASNHRLEATVSAAAPDLTNSLTAASIDLTKVEAIQKKRLVTFVNHFIVQTAR